MSSHLLRKGKKKSSSSLLRKVVENNDRNRAATIYDSMSLQTLLTYIEAFVLRSFAPNEVPEKYIKLMDNIRQKIPKDYPTLQLDFLKSSPLPELGAVIYNRAKYLPLASLNPPSLRGISEEGMACFFELRCERSPLPPSELDSSESSPTSSSSSASENQ